MSATTATPMPPRVASLPRERGFPVPWFVGWVDEAGNEVPPGKGRAEFRAIGGGRIEQALATGRCWICGHSLGRFRVYVAGPMCGVNRISAEPPSHRDCAIYAAQACPFLARPHARRRENGLPSELEEAPGVALKRNPGVAMLWVTEAQTRRRADHLFPLPAPSEVLWYAHGRTATRAEVQESVESGLPSLEALCYSDADRAELAHALAAAKKWWPA